MRHRSDGEMLDRVNLRLNEQVHRKTEHVGDPGPQQCSQRFPEQPPTGFAAPIAQPFIYTVLQELDIMQQALEQGDDPTKAHRDPFQAEIAESAREEIGDSGQEDVPFACQGHSQGSQGRKPHQQMQPRKSQAAPTTKLVNGRRDQDR
ncbi:hypothetical protein HRbin36_01825 [bacterium HR36]|nr:hypothetical protein HRbin36_01825 [bacterium HR36]